jgi:hypothetical protein
MKKIYLVIVVAFSMATMTVAQENEKETETDFRDELRFGVKIGANYSNVYDSQDEEFRAESKLGFAAGLFVSIPIGTYIGIQPEILFSQKGFKATGEILNNPYEITRSVNYLDIPLFAAFKPSEFFTLLAGPQFSYLLRQNDSFSSTSISFDQEQEFEREDIRTNTLCFVIGGDVNLKNIVLGARAGWDVQDNKKDGTVETPRYKNVWYQATIGFAF